MMKFPIYGKIKNAPNHQPDTVNHGKSNAISTIWGFTMGNCVDGLRPASQAAPPFLEQKPAALSKGRNELTV
jgi:hypothetical protein